MHWLRSIKHPRRILFGLVLATGTILAIQVFAFNWGKQYPLDVAYVGQGVNDKPGSRIVLRNTQTATVYLDLRNAGTAAWLNDGPNPVRLGTSRGRDRSSPLASADWISANRPATFHSKIVTDNGRSREVATGTVAPGETARFRFTVRAPSQPYLADEYVQPVIEGRFWLGRDFGIHWQVVANYYDYQWVGQDNPPPVRSTQPQTARVRLRNTGSEPWGPNVRLGTARARDRGSGFSSGTGWLTSNRIGPARNLTAPNKAVVDPGETAEFEFQVKPYEGIYGTYREYFVPVVDGQGWMRDAGISWDWTSPAPVGTMMFFWYGPGEHRWTSTYEKAFDTPWFGNVRGHYDSSNIDVMRQQLKLISNAGFDFVMLDWWLDEPYGRTAYTQANALAAANLIRTEFPALKFSFLVEPIPSGQGTNMPGGVYDYFWQRFGNDPQWFRYHGRPALFGYGRRGTANPHFNTIEYDNYGPGGMYWVLQPARAKNRMLTVMGSFSNQSWCNNAWFCMVLDRDWSGWLFNSQTQVAWTNRSNLEVLVAYGWNEYYERAQIEPHRRPDSNRPPDYMYDLYRQFIYHWKTR